MIHKAKSEPAVSPVIGTILLVAITVVLVAVIAAVVMGISSSVGNTKEVGLTVTQTQPYVYSTGPEGPFFSNLLLGVMIYGGKDVSNLRSLTVQVEGSPFSYFVHGPPSSNGNGFDGDQDRFMERNQYYDEVEFKASEIVGQTFYYAPVAEDEFITFENALCTVIGTFADGTSQVLYKTQVTYYQPEGTNLYWGGWDWISSATQEEIDEFEEEVGFLRSPILT